MATGYVNSPDTTGPQQGPRQGPISAGQIAQSFNPGAFGGGSAPLGPAQAPAYGQDYQNLNNFVKDYYAANIAPSNAMGNAQIQDLSQQNTLQEQMALLNAGFQQQEAGYAQQNLGLDTQQLGIQQGALNRQNALLPQQYGLQTQGFDLSTTEANQAFQQAMQGVNSNAISSGAYGSTGANNRRQSVQQNLQNQLQNIGLQRQGANLNYQEQLAQNKDAQKNLDITSKRLGISGKELTSRLDNTLQQLGISSQIDTKTLLGEAEKVQQGMISPYQGLLQAVSQFAQIPLIKTDPSKLVQMGK